MSAFAGAVHAIAPAADVVVNNAGVALGGNFLDTTLDDIDWIIGINLRGVIHGCHFFAPNMVEAKRGGHIVNISSILGIYGAPSGHGVRGDEVRGARLLRVAARRARAAITSASPRSAPA